MVLVVEDHPIEREPKWSRSLNRPLQHWTRPPRSWSTGPPHAAGTQPSAGVSHCKHTTFILYSQPEDREWNYVHIYLGTFETRSRASPMWSAEAKYHYSYQWIQCQNIYLGGQSGLFVRSAKFEDCVRWPNFGHLPQLAVSQHPRLQRNGNWMSTAYLGFTIASSQNADSIQLFQLLSAFHLLHLQGGAGSLIQGWEKKCSLHKTGAIVNLSVLKHFSRRWNGDGCFSPTME